MMKLWRVSQKRGERKQQRRVEIKEKNENVTGKGRTCENVKEKQRGKSPASEDRMEIKELVKEINERVKGGKEEIVRSSPLKITVKK